MGGNGTSIFLTVWSKTTASKYLSPNQYIATKNDKHFYTQFSQINPSGRKMRVVGNSLVKVHFVKPINSNTTDLQSEPYIACGIICFYISFKETFFLLKDQLICCSTLMFYFVSSLFSTWTLAKSPISFKRNCTSCTFIFPFYISTLKDIKFVLWFAVELTT